MEMQLLSCTAESFGQIQIPWLHDCISLLSYADQPHVLSCKGVWGKKLQNCNFDVQKDLLL